MTEFNGEILPTHESTEIAAKSLMRAVVFTYGIETVEQVFEEAETAQQKGRAGVTKFGDFGEDEFAVAIGLERVSLRFLNGPTYSVETSEATKLLAEIKEEQQHGEG